jgi:hypothetical protein
LLETEFAVGQIQAEHWSARGCQHGRFAIGLSLLQRCECVGTARNLKVVVGAAGDLQNGTGRMAALVILPGGMQKPGALTKGCLQAGRLGGMLAQALASIRGPGPTMISESAE